MANPRTKGKIPRGEWPKILRKYAGGETIAQIGREYGCTAPAIRYIVKRSGIRKSEGGDGSSPRRKVAPPRPARSSAALRGIAPALGDAAISATALPHPSAVAQPGASASLFGAQLLTRVTGDVVSFLAALDYAVMESSAESILVLQEAVDNLMRSTARTRIEFGRILSLGETAGPLHNGPAQPVEIRHRSA